MLRQSFWRRNLHHFVALILFTILTVIYVWPLPLQFTTHVPGLEKSDQYQWIWLMRTVATAIAEQHTNPWFLPNIYYPAGYPLVLGEYTPLHSFILMPLTLLIGAIATHNLVAIASTILTGWGVFALGWIWFKRLNVSEDKWLLFLAAFFAGLMFAFAPYRIMKLQGQINLFNTQFLIMGLFFWDRWLVNFRLRDAALTALAIALAALSTWYLGLILIVGLAPYTLAYGRIWNRLHLRTIIQSVVIMGVVLGLILIPFLLPYTQLPSVPDVPADLARFWVASPTDYLIPNPLSPIWGELTRPFAWPFPGRIPSEFVVSIGFVVGLLAIFAAAKTRGPRWRGLKWMILVAFVLSMGPFFSISRLSTDIPLPALLLRELPVFGNMRTWIRFALMVAMGLSILSGAGLYLVFGRVMAPRLRRLGAAALITLAMVEVWPGTLGTIPIEPRPVDQWLAIQTDESPIMEYPLRVAMSGQGLYSTLIHGKPISYAYGMFFEMVYLERNPELDTFPSDAALDTLKEWGVHYILVTTSAVDEYTPFNMDEVRAQPRLRYVTTQGDVDVFELVPAVSDAT